MWFDASEVWEMRGADLTLSPVHKAAVGHLHAARGCSLRFPRFIQVCAGVFLVACHVHFATGAHQSCYCRRTPCDHLLLHGSQCERPRMQIREDKKPEDASGPDYVVSLFNAQTRKAAL